MTYIPKRRDMYVFTKDIISEKLLEILAVYDMRNRDLKYKSHIQLVPGSVYFLSVDDLNWDYENLIYITQEQVDTYLILFDITSIEFLEYIEMITNGDSK